MEHASPEARGPALEPAIPALRPFRIAIDSAVLVDLRLRLGRTRWWQDEIGGWKHGVDPEYLRALIDHWRDDYDWRRHEAALGELPQFVAPLDGGELHFVHLRRGGVPVLLLHGWPDTFHRYHQVAWRLAQDGFDVVVPSLPGFGFSTVPPARDRPLRRAAGLLHRLMTQVLGYARYGVAGGDLGSTVAQILAIEESDAVIGVHRTDLGWHLRGDLDRPTWAERRYRARLARRLAADGAYAMVHATTPRSVATALDDSPVGLAAWIVDRFHAWSDGDLDRRFGKDTLLTNLMVYWTTRTAGSSVLVCHDEAASPSLAADERADVPVGMALFPRDIGGIPPRRLAERVHPIVRWTEMPRGGHFAALEEPELYARDVSALFRSLA